MALGSGPPGDTLVPNDLTPAQIQRLGTGGNFYQAITTSASWQKLTFGFISQTIMIVNDGTRVAQISFDGSSIHGKISPGETVVMDKRHRCFMWVKDDGAGAPWAPLRIMVW